MNNIIRRLAIVALFIVAFIAVFIIYASLVQFKPDKVAEVYSSAPEQAQPISTNQHLSVMSWNIGYAGLGDNMDFFYDGGKTVRDTKERTAQNLDSISSFIAHNRQMDFFFLQEVDMRSHRSYRINQHQRIADTLKSHISSCGINFQTPFVPIPIYNPIRSVVSGIATFSIASPTLMVRYSYPGGFGWPSSLFNLKRCMLVSRFKVSNGKELILINTHNSAFDDGSLKEQEMEFMRAFVLTEHSRGNYVVVGGDWNQSPPHFPLMTFNPNYHTPYFRLTNIDMSFMPASWQWVYDSTSPTNRYLDKPYIKDDTYTGILDFFLVSPNVKVVECKTINLNFRSSDHNPTTLVFELVE